MITNFTYIHDDAAAAHVLTAAAVAAADQAVVDDLILVSIYHFQVSAVSSRTPLLLISSPRCETASDRWHSSRSNPPDKIGLVPLDCKCYVIIIRLNWLIGSKCF